MRKHKARGREESHCQLVIKHSMSMFVMPTADGGGKRRTMKNLMEKLMEKQYITLATAAQMMQCYSIYLLQQKTSKLLYILS